MPALSRTIFVLLFATAVPLPSRAEPPRLPVATVDQSAIAHRGYFYVGGQYVGEPGKVKDPLDPAPGIQHGGLICHVGFDDLD